MQLVQPGTNDKKNPEPLGPGSSSVVRRLLFQFECFEKLGGEVSANEILILHQLLVEGNGGLHAFDHVFTQGTAHRVDGFLAGLRHRDEFGDHAVVIRRDHIAGVHMAVDTHTMPARRMEYGDLAR